MKVIIFDMDGVIVDSEYTYLMSKTEILNDLGFDKDESYQYQFMGTTYEYMWGKMKEDLGLVQPVSYYIKLMNQKRKKLIVNDGVKPIKGVCRFIEELHANGFRLAVASSSSRYEIEYNLKELDLLKKFEVLVSGEEDTSSKPAPDVYLKVSNLLKISPSECIAIEDTKNGTVSAAKAGIYTLGFDNPSYPSQDLSSANEIFNDFISLDIDSLKQL